jgi:GT2 family glycosyltransferase
MAVVSVVIPTFNAGSDFRTVLRRLRDQRGLLEIEIFAVDSGSGDETLAICREFGVETVAYEGEQFRHGAARTQGVARTRGEYIVFMSQDAYPVGDAALARMARFLADNPEVAAVSGREVPRSDADLFSCWQVWYFNQVILAYPGDTIVELDGGGLAALTPAERRRTAQLNNVFCCVRRTAFEKVGLRPLAFAEDLDLGLRLIENGFSLGFLPSVAAVHSHRRPAAYHLRRLFADWLAQIDLLGFEPFNWEQYGISSVAEVVGGLRRFHAGLGTVLSLLPVDGTPESVKGRLHTLLGQPHAASLPPGDASLDPLLDQLAAAVHAGDECGSPVADAVLADRYGALVDEFFVFAGRLDGLAHRSEDVKRSLLNLFGHLAGWCLADCLRWAERSSRLQPGDLGISDLLGRGV